MSEIIYGTTLSAADATALLGHLTGHAPSLDHHRHQPK